MPRFFVKHGDPRTASLLGEAAALRWLGKASRAGGMPVAKVIRATDNELVEQRIEPTAPTKEAAERVGRALAVTHAAGAKWWGAPPDEWEGDYRIGNSTIPTTSEDKAPESWSVFFAEWRVMPFAQQARDVNALTSEELMVIERVTTRLSNGELDAPQPALLRATDTAIARVHGDLWSGNLLWDADPKNAIGATLIDPMAHGGHAEADLAMLSLFGCPFFERIVAAYDEISPLADGWRDRVRLHQLAPLLHHCALFGRSYAADTMNVARRFA